MGIEFGVWLAESRRAAGLSQATVAHGVEMSRTFVAGLEQGVARLPSSEMGARLDRVLGRAAGTCWGRACEEEAERLDPVLRAAVLASSDGVVTQAWRARAVSLEAENARLRAKLAAVRHALGED
ncbi:MAG: helix-turn-helix domain-containing protein [Planctomycetes bacterium]|nr:helix-turn-helix domain-containing protein [Planctomycetota bacterium]